MATAIIVSSQKKKKTGKNKEKRKRKVFNVKYVSNWSLCENETNRAISHTKFEAFTVL